MAHMGSVERTGRLGIADVGMGAIGDGTPAGAVQHSNG
jgi:hypothetical protein